jgi:hypothetical protein
MLANEYFSSSVPVQIATVVVPVAVYFLILGLLNTRRHPQLLSGRQDFALLIVALCPLFVLPALNYVGITRTSVAVAAAVVAVAIWLLAPRGRTWVIYNMPMTEARNLIERVLSGLSADLVVEGGVYRLPGDDASVHVGGFSLLRNVTLRLHGGSDDLARRFEAELHRALQAVRVEASSMAVALLLVATAMLVAPFTLMVHRVPEIVRVLTDLLQ